MIHNIIRLRRAPPPAHLYTLSKMALMTNRPVLPIPPAVATIGDISARLDPVLSSPAEHRRAAVVAWAGVFGSFARDKQTDASDVDLLVGLVPNAIDDDVYYAWGDVLAQLDETMGRKVDCFFLRHGQPLPFVLCRALLHVKTVYGSEAWLADNGARAKVLFAATMDKVQTILGMMERLLAILDRKADEISATAVRNDGSREKICACAYNLTCIKVPGTGDVTASTCRWLARARVLHVHEEQRPRSDGRLLSRRLRPTPADQENLGRVPPPRATADEERRGQDCTCFSSNGIPACYRELRGIYKPFLDNIASDERMNIVSHSDSVSEGALGLSRKSEERSNPVQP